MQELFEIEAVGAESDARSFTIKPDAGTTVAFPPEGDIAEIPTTRSRTAHSCKNGPPE